MKGMGAKGEKEGEGREEPKIEIDRSARELERTKEKRRGEKRGRRKGNWMQERNGMGKSRKVNRLVRLMCDFRCLYTVSQKKTRHRTLAHNFTKY